MKNPQLFVKPLLQLLFTDRRKRKQKWAKTSRKDIAQRLVEIATKRVATPTYVAIGMIELHQALHRIVDNPYDVEVQRTNKEFVAYIKPFYDDAFTILLGETPVIAMLTDMASVDVQSDVVNIAEKDEPTAVAEPFSSI